MAALLKEAEIVASSLPANEVDKDIIETIYIGGGTPSLCTGEEIRGLLQKINSRFAVASAAEITLEANPDDITGEKLSEWKEAGINRLSIGVQSFFDEDLKWMNRAHNAAQAISSLGAAITRFDNITIDLIYGTPGLTHEKWKQNVQTAIDLGIPHLSCYALTVEPNTPLQKLIRQHKSPDTDPGLQSEQFLLLMQWLEDAGYEHYEISNFARPGFRSRHNSAYWQGKKYYGLGPSAHSFDGNARWWNIANNNAYIRSVNRGILPAEKEELTITQKLNEYIMITLRTSEGLYLKRAEDILTGQQARNNKQPVPETVITGLVKKSRRYIEQGLMTQEGDRLILTKEGKLLADGIAADLFTG